jgi:putative transposase
MYRQQDFVGGAAYHVTSRTNNKLRAFEYPLGWAIMLVTLANAKEKFGFTLTNFCIMPTHIHLLVIPREETALSEIMRWLKTASAKRWNRLHASINHLWGVRYFAKRIEDARDYLRVMDYIDRNPVDAGIVTAPHEWEPSAAYQVFHGMGDLVDRVEWRATA